MKPLRALIIDDMKLIRTELKMLLGDYSEIEVIGEAGDVNDALNFIQRDKPDVLFLDIYLPNLSGFDLLDRVDVDLKIIFISSYFYEYSSKASKYNPVDFLSKPISKKKLSRAIKRLTKLTHNEQITK